MTDILRFDSWERSGRENAGMGSKISIVQDGKIYIVEFPKRIEDAEKSRI